MVRRRDPQGTWRGETAQTFWPMALIVVFILSSSAISTAINEGISRAAGWAFPVLQPALEITGMQVEGEVTIVQGRAFKLRDACRYKDGSLRWWVGEPGGLFQEATARFRDRPQVRAGGWTEWTGIVVGLTPDQIHTKSFARVKHYCPWVPIPITSFFYISKG